MSSECHQLYSFLSACQGNWRGSVHICTHGPGYLLSADRDGHPTIRAVEQFQQLAGEMIDPAECCGQRTEAGFESLYAQYLLWRLPAAEEHPLRRLCENTEVT